MEIPEDVQLLVAQMGASVMAAVSEDPRCRALAEALQQLGWDATLQVEATISLHPREGTQPSGPRTALEPPWSEADRAFLHTFRIRLD